MVRVPEDDTDCASRGRPFVCVGMNLRRLTRGESACYWGGVKAGRDVGGVRVLHCYSDCAFRGRPFVCDELNLCRPVRGEPACY